MPYPEVPGQLDRLPKIVSIAAVERGSKANLDFS